MKPPQKILTEIQKNNNLNFIFISQIIKKSRFEIIATN